jgi:hypothetical protein
MCTNVQNRVSNPSGRLRGRRSGFRRFVMTREGAGRDGEAVPEIDHAEHQDEVDDFFFREIVFQIGIDVVGRVSFRNQRHSFRPGQRGALAVGKEGSLAPGFKRVQALLGFTRGASVDRMHVEAVRAAVDLRGAHFDEVHEFWVETAFGDVLFEAEQVPEWLLREFSLVDSRLHGLSFWGFAW